MMSDSAAPADAHPPAALSETGRSLLREAAAEAGQPLTAAQEDLFDHLYRRLQEGSAQMNLTALQSEQDVVLKHFVDSLSCLNAEAWQGAVKVLDLGTGAGFPALPLAIVRPELQITALDATAKKVAFVERTARELGVNVSGLSGRAEEIGRDEQHRGQYDVVVTRAVAALPVLAELALPLLKVGGVLVAQKGQLFDEERAAGLRAAEQIGGELAEEWQGTLPVLGDPRSLIVLRKVTQTPETYPRRTGVPNKRPLG
ncbi:16S rRNA (guanine(527)-N(7))-methyltransferase RsmG [Deinococcus sp. Marseille-Q6407]|uniref:16S rRNA (guanine(527)-N(7))-methyltransferase RsmG n=1 Tax=Deinococcus sp. Marseille-Q6407 TaxID=2969223 RepID=UPI0028FC230B|nr:16S rRNA (guanine(527)-N(7))-methyltransferase RsmG [Deinococcus sp. Marseille-Q6407]